MEIETMEDHFQRSNGFFEFIEQYSMHSDRDTALVVIHGYFDVHPAYLHGAKLGYEFAGTILAAN